MSKEKIYQLITVLLLSCSNNGEGFKPTEQTYGGTVFGGGTNNASGVSGTDTISGTSGTGTSGTGNASYNYGGSSGELNSGGFAGTGQSGQSGETQQAGSSGSLPINTFGGTIDVGDGGTENLGGTIDVSSGGSVDVNSGGTVDVSSGGSVDVSSGGSIDLNTGGSVDLGTGGTIDLPCIPTCTPDILGFGEDAVNLLVFEDASASGCDTEGRMWVGGNATLSGYGVGQRLLECDAETPVLVVGGDLSVQGGIKGRIWVGGELLSGTSQCGGVWSNLPAPVDFAYLETTLTAYSERISEYPANGTTSVGSPTIFSATNTDLNVFSISGDDMLSSNGFVFDVPLSSTVIVNVTGTSGGFVNGSTTLPDGVVCGSGSVSLDDFCNKLVWNFPEATSITVSGTAVQGSVLAPLASFGSNGSGQVNGTVIVQGFELDSCIEMHPHYFNGCLCTAEGEYACCVN